MQIDAIEQRSGDSLAITLNLKRAATAFALQIAKVPAGTRVHRSHEHELGGERHAASRARDRDFAVFQRMTVSPLTLPKIGRQRLGGTRGTFLAKINGISCSGAS